jgi:hypothetical protein
VLARRARYGLWPFNIIYYHEAHEEDTAEGMPLAEEQREIRLMILSNMNLIYKSNDLIEILHWLRG